MLLALPYWHCVINTVLLAQCYYHCAKGTVTVLLATRFNSREFTLFWRELHYIAKYAVFVLFFLAEIFICAILYAFSISAPHGHYQNARVINLIEASLGAMMVQESYRV